MLMVEDLFRFAVVHLELSPKAFWRLSWYEWGLYLQRHNHRIEKENADWENGWQQARIIMTMLHNANFKGRKKVTDFIKLSFDKPEKVSVPITPEEVINKFTKKSDAK